MSDDQPRPPGRTQYGECQHCGHPRQARPEHCPCCGKFQNMVTFCPNCN